MENCYFNQDLDMSLLIDIWLFDSLKKWEMEKPLQDSQIIKSTL